MSWFDHLPIARKILVVSGVSVFMLALVGILGIRSLGSVSEYANVEVSLAETSESLLQRELDHVEWLRAAGEFRNDARVRDLGVSVVSILPWFSSVWACWVV